MNWLKKLVQGRPKEPHIYAKMVRVSKDGLRVEIYAEHVTYREQTFLIDVITSHSLLSAFHRDELWAYNEKRLVTSDPVGDKEALRLANTALRISREELDKERKNWEQLKAWEANPTIVEADDLTDGLDN